MGDMKVSKEQEQIFRDYEQLLLESIAKIRSNETIDTTAIVAMHSGIRLIRAMHDIENGRTCVGNGLGI